MDPVCPPPLSSSTSKSAAEESPSKLCLSVWPLLKARHDMHLNQMKSCISWQQRALENRALNVRRERETDPAAAARRSPRPDLKWSNFTLSHFPMQEERCCLSEMKKHAGSQQMNCLELDNESMIHCGSIWSCQCWVLWKQGTEDCGSWNTLIEITLYKIEFTCS